MDQFREWTQISRRLAGILNETEAELEKRREWLREYMRRGGGATHVAAGQGLAAALLAAAVLCPDSAPVERLLVLENSSQGRECFRHDFARWVIVHLHRSLLRDDLACSVQILADRTGAALLAELLHCLAYESGQLEEEIAGEAGIGRPD